MVGAEVNVASDELLTHSQIIPLFTKAKTRRQFAALLVAELIDESTRLKSNVNGVRKEQLDPTIIEYVQTLIIDNLDVMNTS